MASSTFVTEMTEWTLRYEAYSEAVFKDATQATVAEMQKVGPNARDPSAGEGGRMPVDLGFLRASLMASTAAMPVMDKKAPEGRTPVPYSPDDVNLIIRNAEIGKPIFVGFTAVYARRVNYGFTGQDKLGREYNQEGRLFVEHAAEQWSELVAKSEAKARAASGLA